MNIAKIKDFWVKNKKWIIIACVLLVIIITLCIVIPTVNKNNEKNKLVGELEAYLTNECRIEVTNITVTERTDYKGDFDGYNATVYCDNLADFSYDEMTSIVWYKDMPDMSIQEFICNGSTYKITHKKVTVNGVNVYTKEGSDYVTLKCKHNWSDWKQDEPCGYFEYIRCTLCGEEKDWRVAENRHDYDVSGVCKNCHEKVYYTQSEVRNIIQILAFDVGEYNGEALSDIYIVWKNVSQKEIDKIIFGVRAQYGNETNSQSCKSEINLAPGGTMGGGTCWETLWPSNMSGEVITSINITYTDGTTVTINGESVEFAFFD